MPLDRLGRCPLPLPPSRGLGGVAALLGDSPPDGGTLSLAAPSSPTAGTAEPDPAAGWGGGPSPRALRVDRFALVHDGAVCVGTLDDVIAGRFGRVRLYLCDREHRRWHRAWFREHGELPAIGVGEAAA